MSPHERARAQFPSVLLSVLGIIQALALELLWEKGVAGIGRWSAVDATAAGVLQVSSVFLGIVLIWVMYATLVMRFAWTPRFFDLVVPFAIGLLEFLLVELMEPQTLASWLRQEAWPSQAPRPSSPPWSWRESTWAWSCSS